MPPDSEHLVSQLIWLFALSIPVACAAWTVTHEEVFREPREYCQRRCADCRHVVQRKFFYLFTCEYCFSHYVTMVFLLLTRFKFLLDDWRGYVLALFAVVWVANFYMAVFARMRVDLRAGRVEADVRTQDLEVKKLEIARIENEDRQP